MAFFRPEVLAAMVSKSSDQHKQSRGKRIAKSTISGAVTGAIEICITYPTEYVKTMQQLYPEYQQKGMINCGKETVALHGVRGLYRGLGALLFFAIPKVGVRFGTKDIFDEYIFTTKDRKSNFFSGACAGATEALLIVTTQETVKTKIVHDRLKETPKFNGLFDGMRQIYAKEGINGLYKGPAATVAKQGSNQAIRFLTYGETKVRLEKKFPNMNETAVIFTSGAAAGLASCLGNTPIDVIKTQQQGLDAHKYNGVADVVRQTWKNEGFLGFYKGLKPRLSRVVLDVALTFTLFEYTKRLLNVIWP